MSPNKHQCELKTRGNTEERKKKRKKKWVGGGVSLSQEWLYNMELLECVQKREFGQQLRRPHLIPVVSRDQLCVTKQHNQSVDIAFIDML